jgi:hypothetical protein
MEIELPIVEKTKAHFRKYKTWYCCAGAGLLSAGITWVILRESHAGLDAGTDGDLILNKSIMGSLFGSNTNTMVTTIHKGNQGHPGFVTRCIETGELFATQGDAAKAFNIPEEFMSKHLNYGRELSENLNFERVGVLA